MPCRYSLTIAFMPSLLNGPQFPVSDCEIQAILPKPGDITLELLYVKFQFFDDIFDHIAD